MIEISTGSGIAKCHICNKMVEKNSSTVRANFGSKYMRTMHLQCFKDKHWGFIYELYYNMSVAEMEDLSQS